MTYILNIVLEIKKYIYIFDFKASLRTFSHSNLLWFLERLNKYYLRRLTVCELLQKTLKSFFLERMEQKSFGQNKQWTAVLDSKQHHSGLISKKK